MATDIFIKTYPRDAEYHKYCLLSIEKFCTGFRSVRVINDEHPNGYLWQQAVKMDADRLTWREGDSPEDYFLMTDSDTLFTEPVTPESFMRGGKPIWLYTPWTPEMLEHAGMQAWKKVMKDFTGVEPHAEFMRRQPFMFPRKVLASMREFCQDHHGKSLGEYIMSSKAFSEYNALGQFCWLFHHDEFYWLDTSKEELPPLLTRQLWSHDSVEKNLPEIKSILGIF
jgi:hypothetical protein